VKLGWALNVAGAWATPENQVRVAQRAEALGYSGLWVLQRLLYATRPKGDYPPMPGQPWPKMFESVADPIVSLAFVAGQTTRIRLGTSVLIMPYYSPILLAKQLATLDQVSGGRLDVGLGLGWSIYGRKLRATADARDPLATAMPGVFTALANRLGFDELYAATLGRVVAGVAIFSDVFDRFVWDGAVRAVAALARVFGLLDQQAEDNVINAGFDTGSEKLRSSGKLYSRAQTGDANGYLLAIGAGLVVLVLVLVIGGAR